MAFDKKKFMNIKPADSVIANENKFIAREEDENPNPPGQEESSTADTAANFATDIGMGAVSGMAATRGALAAAPYGPQAMLIAAALSGGGVSGGLELARQKIKQFLMGHPEQDINTGDVIKSGISGAVAPALFGTGVKTAAKGLIPSLYNKVTREGIPHMAEKITNVRKKSFLDYVRHPKEIAAMENQGAQEVMGDMAEALIDFSKQRVKHATDLIDTYIKKSKRPIDISNVKQLLKDKIRELNAKGTLVPAEESEKEHLKALFKEHFTTPQTYTTYQYHNGVPLLNTAKTQTRYVEIGNHMNGKDMYALKARLQDSADKFFSPQNPTSMNKQVGSTAGDLIGELDKATDRAIARAPALRRAWRNAKSDESLVRSKLYAEDKYGTKDYTRAYWTLTGLDKPRADRFKKYLTKIDTASAAAGQPTNYVHKADLLQSMRDLQNPSWSPVSGMGKTSTSGTIATQVGGELAGSLMDPGTKAAVKPISKALSWILLGPAQFKYAMQKGKALENKIPKIPEKMQPMVWESIANIIQDKEI